MAPGTRNPSPLGKLECSAALMVGFLRTLGCPVLHHVPDRIKEGYGPNAPALESLIARGASLIVCVDCGTAASDALSAVAGQSDVIVLDLDSSRAGKFSDVIRRAAPNAKLIFWARDETLMEVLDPSSSDARVVALTAPEELRSELTNSK